MMIHVIGGGIMGKGYSLDLRKRIAGWVEAGHSRREAARHFGVSESCAVKLMQRVAATGIARAGATRSSAREGLRRQRLERANLTTSIPSANFTPRMTFGNWL